MKSEIRVGFAGNPNCGKTTLFNAYTGANLKVANWPGVTVEKKEGETEYKGRKMRLIDLPGIYSLTSYSMEEKVSRKVILGDEVDIIVDVVDASALERNLYLTLQLLELGKPVVVALNMMDIVEERGMEIDLHRLPELLGNIPVVPVSARKRTGLDVLLLEANHDVNMLQVGRYPYYLKQRILGNKGHLSNETAGRLLCRLLHDRLQAVFLGHLSQENNYEALAYETVCSEVTMGENPWTSSDFKITVAHRDRISDLVTI